MDGLKFRVKSEELKAHLAKRAEYHRTRAADKTAELGPLKEAMERIKTAPAGVGVAAFKNSSSYRMDPDSPVEMLEADIKTHNSKAVAFGFMSEHLFDSEYTLSQEDLVAVEFMRRI